MEGDQLFRVELTGAGDIDFSYDSDTDSVTINDGDNTDGTTTLTITDLSGTDLDVPNLSFDQSIGSIVSNVDLGDIDVASWT